LWSTGGGDFVSRGAASAREGEQEHVIALLLSMGSAGVLAAYAARVASVGRYENARLAGLRGTRLLGRYPIEAFHWIATGVGRKLARAHVAPDALTWASLVLTALTLPLAALGHFEAAGAVLLLGATFDVLDGIVARELGVASEAGEMLDSVVDRYADASCLVGLGLFYRDSAWRLAIVFFALLGSTMVSYVRAKAEKFRLSLPDTLMRRAERVVYLSLALLLGSAVPNGLVTILVVAMVGVLSNVAAVQLLVEARAALRQRRAPRASHARCEVCESTETEMGASSPPRAVNGTSIGT
jgi:CDP-diacylglycerol--glycerol-3-phosphate 3-phosphatidyltransferase